MLVTGVNRRAEKGTDHGLEHGHADRRGMGDEVAHAQRFVDGDQIVEHRLAAGELAHLFLILRAQAGDQAVLDITGSVEGDDRAVAGLGQPAGAVHDLSQYGVEVEILADPQDRLGQCCVSPTQRRILGLELFAVLQRDPSPRVIATSAEIVTLVIEDVSCRRTFAPSVRRCISRYD